MVGFVLVGVEPHTACAQARTLATSADGGPAAAAAQFAATGVRANEIFGPSLWP